MKIALLLAPLALLAGCSTLSGGIQPLCDTTISATSTAEQIAREFEARGIAPDIAARLAEKARQASNIAATVCNILRQITDAVEEGASPNQAAMVVLTLR